MSSDKWTKWMKSTHCANICAEWTRMANGYHKLFRLRVKSLGRNAMFEYKKNTFKARLVDCEIIRRAQGS